MSRDTFDVRFVTCAKYPDGDPETSRLADFLRANGIRTLIRWNSNKRYILDLAARDIAIVPTGIVVKGDRSGLDSAVARRGCTDSRPQQAGMKVDRADTARLLARQIHGAHVSDRPLKRGALGLSSPR